uniref:Fatty acyl-CoA reductase n=1 Tax=Romanomermis culicivorax TaxID=13658 RepID=A0A915KWH3_ROMCU
MNATEISDFYDQRSILITGSTGFLGKVLVEKLLRSVPSLKRVFLLIRPCPKNSTSAKHRLDGLLHSQLFSILKEKSPHVFEKVIAVDGNLTDENLGLSENDAKTLLNEVSIVFHCAATVKFDEALRLLAEISFTICQC